MAYDARGNMTGDGGGTYTYNANNLLTSATQSGVTSTLTYDAENRLLSISKNGATTKFLYDGADLIAEYDGSGALQRRYVHGPGSDEPLVWYEGSGTGTKYYLGANELGSVTVITNSSGGQHAINTYDEYGLPGAGNTGRFQYTGQTYLPEIGMYYYKARLYNPVLGRFMQTDPIGYGDGMNWYAYVGNDPINGTDPTGLECAGLQTPANNSIAEQACAGNAAADEIEEVIVRAKRRGENPCHGSVLNQMGCWANRYDRWSESHPFLSAGADLALTLACPVCGTAKGVYDFARNPTLENGLSILPVGKLLKGGRLAFKALKGVERACGCFVAGTLVATPTGLVEIEDIKVGDLVLAYDEATGQTVAKPVTDLIRPEPKPTYLVELKSDSGEGETIRATADHPWFTAGHQWVTTEALKAGDLIETATGTDFRIASISFNSKLVQTYNLTVADLHTFMIGENHLVVHNVNCWALAVSKGLKFHPDLPNGFSSSSIKKVNINNNEVAESLRAVGTGSWKKVYNDGVLPDGSKVSVHYFQDTAGNVTNVKTRMGWSNGG